VVIFSVACDPATCDVIMATPAVSPTPNLLEPTADSASIDIWQFGAYQPTQPTQPAEEPAEPAEPTSPSPPAAAAANDSAIVIIEDAAAPAASPLPAPRGPVPLPPVQYDPDTESSQNPNPCNDDNDSDDDASIITFTVSDGTTPVTSIAGQKRRADTQAAAADTDSDSDEDDNLDGEQLSVKRCRRDNTWTVRITTPATPPEHMVQRMAVVSNLAEIIRQLTYEVCAVSPACIQVLKIGIPHYRSMPEVCIGADTFSLPIPREVVDVAVSDKDKMMLIRQLSTIIEQMINTSIYVSPARFGFLKNLLHAYTHMF
jgi:hypothetical protein